MASVTPNKSHLHYSAPDFSTPAFIHSGLIHYRKTHLGFQSIKQIRWKNLSLENGREQNLRARSRDVCGLKSIGNDVIIRTTHRNTKKQQQKKFRGCGVVNCAAEGIERGLLQVGGRSQESNEFMVAERFKVVALVACIMCLCNADRVVMSVAIVPLAAKQGWSSSFLGIVQVTPNSHPPPPPN